MFTIKINSICIIIITRILNKYKKFKLTTMKLIYKIILLQRHLIIKVFNSPNLNNKVSLYYLLLLNELDKAVQ